MTQTPPVLMTIAGSDCSSGAGIQADIKTACAHGVFATSILTSITAQNTQKVSCSYSLPAKIVQAQFEAIWEDFEVAIIKIGLLGNADIIKQIAVLLSMLGKDKPPVVLDPVMVSSSGRAFLDEDAIASLKTELLPWCDIITPNIKESESLLLFSITSRGDMEKAARLLVEQGLCKSALITGGEGLKVGCSDVLYSENQMTWFEGRRVETKNTHGTGCTFSTALACYLAKGFDLEEAIHEAKRYVEKCLSENINIHLGHGSGPLLHGCNK